jgi:hypothetical protein
LKPRLVHQVVAAGFAIAALYHAAALAWPELAESSPPWRHALFVAINGAMAAGMLLRPRAFTAIFAALVVQQIVSHGSRALSVWRTEGRVDWPSAIVLVAVPIALALLVRAALSTRGRDRPGSPPTPPS